MGKLRCELEPFNPWLFSPLLAVLTGLGDKTKYLLLWPSLLFTLSLPPYSWQLKGPFNSIGFIEVIFIPHWFNCNL